MIFVFAHIFDNGRDLTFINSCYFDSLDLSVTANNNFRKINYPLFSAYESRS